MIQSNLWITQAPKVSLDQLSFNGLKLRSRGRKKSRSQASFVFQLSSVCYIDLEEEQQVVLLSVSSHHYSIRDPDSRKLLPFFAQKQKVLF